MLSEHTEDRFRFQEMQTHYDPSSKWRLALTLHRSIWHYKRPECKCTPEEQRFKTLRALSSFHRQRRPFRGTTLIPNPYQSEAYLHSEFYNKIIMERLNNSLPYETGVLTEQHDSWKFLKTKCHSPTPSSYYMTMTHPRLKWLGISQSF